jgi:hypothetical protein
MKVGVLGFSCSGFDHVAKSLAIRPSLIDLNALLARQPPRLRHALGLAAS